MSRSQAPSRAARAAALACILILCAPSAARGSAGAGPTRPAAAGPAALLPAGALGYSPVGEDRLYSSETLFDLIDGGAEVYRAFNVRRVASRRYGRRGAPDILVDVFDMGSSRDAFGAYHHDMRDGRDPGIGDESEIGGGALAFRKGRFFVSIVALDDTGPAREAMLALGRAIAGRIPRPGAAPEVLRLLPAEGLDPARVSYFHDWTYLNTRCALAEDNLLLLDGETEGILARYRGTGGGSGGAGTGSFTLMVVRYPSAARARRALAGFLSGYLPAADADGVGRRADGTWAAARAAGELVVVVLDAADRPGIGRLVEQILRARGR